MATQLQHPIKHEHILSDDVVNPPHLPGNHEIDPITLSNSMTSIISTALLTDHWAASNSEQENDLPVTWGHPQEQWENHGGTTYWEGEVLDANDLANADLVLHDILP